MGKLQKAWARTARLSLMLKHGFVCRNCGSEDNLTFDCIEDCGDLHHKYDTSHRMSFYHHQDRQGNIQVLCAGCNAIKAEISKQILYDDQPY